MESSSYYAIIPACVRYDNSLCANSKLLYGEISAMCSVEGYCWAENSYFADLYNVSTFTISRWVSKLEKSGHVKTELNKKAGNTRKIFLCVNVKKGIDKKRKTSIQKTQNLLTKNAIPIDEKSKSIYENNTINNTINNREEKSLAFFKKNCSIVYEQMLMKYKSKIIDFNHFEQVLQLKLDEEQFENNLKKLGPRIERFFINYVRNEIKPNNIELATIEKVPVYLREKF